MGEAFNVQWLRNLPIAKDGITLAELRQLFGLGKDVVINFQKTQALVDSKKPADEKAVIASSPEEFAALATAIAEDAKALTGNDAEENGLRDNMVLSVGDRRLRVVAEAALIDITQVPTPPAVLSIESVTADKTAPIAAGSVKITVEIKGFKENDEVTVQYSIGAQQKTAQGKVISRDGKLYIEFDTEQITVTSKIEVKEISLKSDPAQKITASGRPVTITVNLSPSTPGTPLVISPSGPGVVGETAKVASPAAPLNPAEQAIWIDAFKKLDIAMTFAPDGKVQIGGQDVAVDLSNGIQNEELAAILTADGIAVTTDQIKTIFNIIDGGMADENGVAGTDAKIDVDNLNAFIGHATRYSTLSGLNSMSKTLKAYFAVGQSFAVYDQAKHAERMSQVKPSDGQTVGQKLTALGITNASVQYQAISQFCTSNALLIDRKEDQDRILNFIAFLPEFSGYSETTKTIWGVVALPAFTSAPAEAKDVPARFVDWLKTAPPMTPPPAQPAAVSGAAATTDAAKVTSLTTNLRRLGIPETMIPAMVAKFGVSPYSLPSLEEEGADILHGLRDGGKLSPIMDEKYVVIPDRTVLDLITYITTSTEVIDSPIRKLITDSLTAIGVSNKLSDDATMKKVKVIFAAAMRFAQIAVASSGFTPQDKTTLVSGMADKLAAEIGIKKDDALKDIQALMDGAGKIQPDAKGPISDLKDILLGATAPAQ